MYNTDLIKTFPDKPGCYIMKNVGSEVIYVGKAKNLKKRVIQYFNGQDKRSKIENLRKFINTIDYVVTNSELEALILENNLIKEHRPFFNTLLKDDKQYPYIKITNEKYPRLLITKRFENDKANYFGPFTDSGKVNEIVDILQKEYKLVMCKNFEENGCLYYHIKKCSAPCMKKIEDNLYMENVSECKNVLEGHIQKLVKKLTDKMNMYSENLQFEEALKTKNEIESVKYITNKQFVQLQSQENEDIIVNKENIIVLFRIRDGKLLSKQNFTMSDSDDNVSEFIKQFYSSLSGIPSVIYLEKEIENTEIIEEFLKNICGKKVSIHVPQKGAKKKLLDLAIKNAKILVNENIRKKTIKKEREILGIKNIEKLLGFKINRIESFDISNTSGTQNVASMVVFEEGKPQKKKYRKFKLSVKGSNDYECMREVIKRRFTDKKLLETLPDVLFMDGGKGQVSAAAEILKDLNINIKICGMVKDDAHNTRALMYAGKELDIKKTSPEFKLITFIQDETHNFAINYHKNLRNKSMTKSVLDDIKGLGKVKKNLLIKTFKSVENIKTKTIDELCSVKGINKTLAKEILNALNK